MPSLRVRDAAFLRGVGGWGKADAPKKADRSYRRGTRSGTSLRPLPQNGLASSGHGETPLERLWKSNPHANGLPFRLIAE